MNRAVAARRFTCVALAALAAAPASAGTPDRDKTWDAFMAEAKKHGGQPTQFKNSISYVFPRNSGGFLTLIQMQDSPTRAVCLMDQTQVLEVCGDWDSQKLRYGLRADAAAAWAYSDTPPAAPSQNLFSSLGALIRNMMGTNLRYRYRWDSYMRWR